MPLCEMSKVMLRFDAYAARNTYRRLVVCKAMENVHSNASNSLHLFDPLVAAILQLYGRLKLIKTGTKRSGWLQSPLIVSVLQTMVLLKSHCAVDMSTKRKYCLSRRLILSRV